MFECILQRPKRVVLEGLMRMVVGDYVSCSRKRKKNKKNKEKVVWSLKRSESFRCLVRE